MVTRVEGIYRNGRIELVELPINFPEETRVIVTFEGMEGVNLSDHAIDQSQSEVLRASLATFAEDWNSPEMSIYDTYEAVKFRG